MVKARWIWQNKHDRADEYAEFFDSFEYFGGKAEIKISCDSKYALYVNGSLTGFGQYADYPWYKVFDRIDITSCLRHGKNDLKIIVWYYGKTYFTYFKGKPGLIYEITGEGKILSYSSKKTLCRISDNYVSYLKKEITNQILGYSYRYDTRKKEETQLDFAAKMSGFTYDLNPRPVKYLELTETFLGKNICSEKQIYDLGCERVGLLHIKLKAESGTLVNIAFGEHLTDGGVRRFIDTYPLREGILPRDYSVEIIANGNFTEYLNPFRRLGCRYLQITADSPVEIEFIGLKETLYPVEIVPFKAENELRQKIYDTCVRTLRLCMHEHYEDSPWREQTLYVLDSRNQMLCGYYAFKEYEFARAALKLLGTNELVGGLIATSAPGNTHLVIPAFALFYIIQMREYIEHSKDISVAEEFYDRMNDGLHLMTGRMENGLIPNFDGDETYFNFYEWSADFEVSLFQKDVKRFDIELNCILSMALQSMGAIATHLNKPFEYKGLSDKLNSKIDSHYYNQKTQLYHKNELANSLAVLCGAATQERAKRVCEILSSENNGLVPVTLSMLGFKYDALLKTNIKYKSYILADIDKTYGYMLDKGATSFWETINGESAFNNAGSLCHGWSAMPAYYYHLFSKKQ